MKTRTGFMRIIAVAALSLTASAHGAAAAQSSPDDAAHILAGMAPAANSPLARVADDAGWKRHAKFFDAAWDKLDNRQLAKVAAWRDKNMPAARSVMFYMFSGPDFLYANAFFPKASTYVLSGLEPIGQVPEIADIPAKSLATELRQLQASLSSVIAYSFFSANSMKNELRASKINGALPLLYVFLARSGKTIDEVNFIDLDRDGAVQPQGKIDPKLATKGVRIAFTSRDGQKQSLYYFTTDLSDAGIKKNGAFLKFCDKLGTGDSFLKSASYLLHAAGFDDVRNFLLRHSMALLQDDSGVPVQYFKGDAWELRPYGRYLGPISLFRGNYQSQLARLFKGGKREALDFGVGYRWRSNESNLLLAVKKSKAAEGAKQ